MFTSCMHIHGIPVAVLPYKYPFLVSCSFKLQLYDLVENKVQGDGNCQFRSLSDQLYRSPEHHKFVREQVINQLKSYPEIYEGYVPMAYGEYLKRMSK
ncbi:hypothetical protein Pint_06010 [Pistacia integerrima]|uniref:Uncharacterized protein n=1 Tax=Pistacia integerrima TaxID=434235 RepID=A0ACC0Z9B6_9ROSI|nr:hypothetical protein Pint_06010 [Pistacia integerrima]